MARWTRERLGALGKMWEGSFEVVQELPIGFLRIWSGVELAELAGWETRDAKMVCEDQGLRGKMGCTYCETLYGRVYQHVDWGVHEG